jgi:hypothetical protein
MELEAYKICERWATSQAMQLFQHMRHEWMSLFFKLSFVQVIKACGGLEELDDNKFKVWCFLGEQLGWHVS